MKFGKPVFLSDKTSLPEVGGDAAFYWDNFDPEYMKGVILNHLDVFNNNPAPFLEKIKARADYFSWDKAAAEYIKLYR